MNGWTNWATFNVAAWFSNDETLYKEQRRLVRIKGERLSADDVEWFIRGWMPNGSPDMQSADELKDVDWQEIADAWKA